MQSVGLAERLRAGGSILFLGAHSDDIEIGCGGTINKLTRADNKISVNWIVFSASDQREDEARASADDTLKNVSRKDVFINHFRNGYFPFIGAELKEYFESLKELSNPDIIFTHYRHDMHQDHRTISELTWNTFRDHMIVEYEIPKFDSDLGSPNVFVTLETQDLERKNAILQTHFRSQHEKQWFTPDTFTGLSRLRGIQCNSPTGLAEAFYAQKIVLE